LTQAYALQLPALHLETSRMAVNQRSKNHADRASQRYQFIPHCGAEARFLSPLPGRNPEFRDTIPHRGRTACRLWSVPAGPANHPVLTRLLHRSQSGSGPVPVGSGSGPGRVLLATDPDPAGSCWPTAPEARVLGSYSAIDSLSRSPCEPFESRYRLDTMYK